MTERKQIYQNNINSKRAILQQKPSRSTGRILEDNRETPKSPVAQRKPNNTGLPDNLKSGMESVSGVSLDHVKVHYNSDKPAAVQAHAYAQGSDIHLASGQEKHLPHELGHVVQQMQGKVQPTTSVGGVAVNDNPGLEKEADVMGAKALQMKEIQTSTKHQDKSYDNRNGIIQRKLALNYQSHVHHTFGTYAGALPNNYTGNRETVGLYMEAYLNPHKPIMGSATDSNNTPMYKALWASNGIVRGHLLNHDLGGMGIPQNLFPITSGANARHSNEVEQPLKGDLKAAKNDNEAQNYGIKYTVKVLANSNNSGFRCTWSKFEQNQNNNIVEGQSQSKDIASKYVIGTKSDPYAFGGKVSGLANWHHGNRKGNADNFTVGGKDVAGLGVNDVSNKVNLELNNNPFPISIAPHTGNWDVTNSTASTGGGTTNILETYSHQIINFCAESMNVSPEDLIEACEDGTTSLNELAAYFVQNYSQNTRMKTSIEEEVDQ